MKSTCTLTLTDKDGHSLTMLFGDGRPPSISVDGHSIGFTLTACSSRVLGQYLVSDCGTDEDVAKVGSHD